VAFAGVPNFTKSVTAQSHQSKRIFERFKDRQEKMVPIQTVGYNDFGLGIASLQPGSL
jgi:hypothetical protein